MSVTESTDDLQEGSLISHLLELRNRLLYIVIAIVVVFIPAAIFSDHLYHLLAVPVLSVLSKNSELIVTNPLQAFLTPIRLAFFVAVLITVPFTLYQIWAFVAPGLYKREKGLVLPLLVSSTVLFYAGMAFAYFVVFPLVFRFLSGFTPAGVQFMPDIKAYQDFVFTLFLAFGAAFELPVALVLLARAGVVDPDKLAKKRPYVVLWIFVVAAFLTPPDALSQTFLAIPMLILFEIGLIFARRVYPKDLKEDEDEIDGASMEADLEREIDRAREVERARQEQVRKKAGKKAGKAKAKPKTGRKKSATKSSSGGKRNKKN
jgi:sec-independent protein translocase protein TatC